MILLLRCLLAASAPAVLWLWLFHRRDRFQPEPWRLVLKTVAGGALIAAPVWLLEGIPLPGGPFVQFFVRIALVEEAAKLFVVWAVAYRRPEFDEPIDGVVYGVAAALGFATIENAVYAVVLGEGIVVYRAFTSTLVHVALTGLAGYQLALVKLGGRGRGVVAAALAAVTALHGAYDYLLARAADPATPDLVGRIAVVVTVPACLLLLWDAMRRADRISPWRGGRGDEPRGHGGPESGGG